jgi:pimeloyl-ACP methyl ester carboxylesterase
MTAPRRPLIRRPLVVVLAALVASLVAPLVGGPVPGGGVAGAASGSGAGALPADPAPPPIAWAPCPTQKGYQCGTVPVPVDYRKPRGASIDLAVIEKPATDPSGAKGVLLFNPGGPGESGVQILPVLAALVPPAVSQEFDLVSFDERGTGASDRLNCGPSPAEAASVVPVPAKAGAPLPAAAIYGNLAAACRSRYPTLLAHIDTTDAARDMDRIRQALGVRQINYWGISYGTVLGSVYAHLFPGRIGAMILDGAVEGTSPLATQAVAEAPAIVASLNHFFATCGGSTDCPLGSDPRTYYDQLAARLRENPLPAPGDGDDVPVTVGDLYTATLFFLSVPTFGNGFLTALVAATAGNGAPLRALSLAFEQDLDGTSLVGPEWTYTCNDAARVLRPVAAGRLARSLAARYGTIGAYAVSYNLGGCVDWPGASQPVTDLSVPGRKRILVIGNTGDPNTPHSAAVLLTRTLGAATLVTWRGWGHTWLLNGGSDACMRQVVDTYLSSQRLPAAGTVCS